MASEERGQISIAEGGTLTRDLDAAMLRKVLQRYFGPRTRITRDLTRQTGRPSKQPPRDITHPT